MDLADGGRIDWAAHPRLSFVRGDVLDAALVDELVGRCGLVLHLAAVVGVDEYIKQPEHVLDVNILGARNVLLACERHHRPVLMTSTSEVYGKNQDVLIEDSDSLLGPSVNRRWSYAVSKLAAEHYARALASLGLRYVIVRYFNVYGPLMDEPGRGRVISKFVGCIQRGEPLSLVDSGGAVRAFCYVDDAVEATVRLALALEEGDDGVSGRSFNIGRDEPVTIRDLAGMMIRLSGHERGMVDVPGARFFGSGFEEVPLRVPDVTALQSAIGFTAGTPLDEGLRRTLRYWHCLHKSE